MTPSFIVDTNCGRSHAAFAMWGLCAGNGWPLDRRYALYNGACVSDLSSTSCSLGSPSFFQSRAVQRGAAVSDLEFEFLLPVSPSFELRV